MTSYPQCMPDGEIEALIESEPFACGTSRHAYRVLSDPDVIVKKSLSPRNSGNILEWTIWLGAEHVPALSAVLARCLCLSESGLYLVMEHLDDISDADFARVPDLPAWCNDTKPDAFGKQDGAIKVRDYGVVKFDVLLNSEMVKPPAWAVNAQMQAFRRGMRRT